MGQQQIILILLVTIIVGIATILAINTMQDAHQRSNHEAIRQRLLEVTTIAQTYYRKDEALGGGGGTFNNVGLADLQLDSSNTLGSFSITSAGQESFTITVQPVTGGDDIVGVIYADRIEFQE